LLPAFQDGTKFPAWLMLRYHNFADLGAATRQTTLPKIEEQYGKAAHRVSADRDALKRCVDFYYSMETQKGRMSAVFPLLQLAFPSSDKYSARQRQ
jgi:hypothetical protein